MAPRLISLTFRVSAKPSLPEITIPKKKTRQAGYCVVSYITND